MRIVKTDSNRSKLNGQRFFRLLVLRRIGKGPDNHIIWLCKCDCGNTTRAASNTLKMGRKRSCGCLRSEAARKRIKRDGVWNEGKSYSIQQGTRCYRTRHAWSKAVIRHYGNRCQRCGWDKGRCDTHHKEPKADGGLHTIENGEVLCPNCHRLAEG